MQVRIANLDRRQSDETGHFIEWYRSSGAIVEEDGVRLQQIGLGGRNWEGNIHDRPRNKLICGWINQFNPRPGMVLLFKGRIIVS